MSDPATLRVAIVGAGPAGLTAAWELAEAGVRDIVVLEATGAIGGLSQSVEYKGNRIDIGGHRFFSKSKDVVDLWKEILPDDFIARPRLSRIYYGGKYYSYPLSAFEALITQGEVDVIQPDIARAGGLTECRRIAEMAARHHRLCVFHAWKSGILVAATLHMAAIVPDLPFVEYTVSESPLRRELVRSSVQLDGGMASIPQEPGLGVELDEAVLKRYRVDL